MQTVDISGRLIRTGGVKVTVKIPKNLFDQAFDSPSRGSYEVHNRKDGTYSFEYICGELLNVFNVLNGDKMKGSPFIGCY